jgi:hypothetical protein
MFDSSESCRPTPVYSTVTIDCSSRAGCCSARALPPRYGSEGQCRGRRLFCKGYRHSQLQSAVLCAWSARSAIRSGAPPTTRLSRQNRWSMQQLECPRNRNVVWNVAKEVMRNRQNRATGHFRDYPLTGHAADMPKSTKMTHKRHCSVMCGTINGHIGSWTTECSGSLL